eukprot:GHUV01004402.1.p1 GENE.GHUV01004402.1~~GHUV01004402.1.p1  ORF type:complete len:472 (+),score=66.76 GHUV01004402.1:83-1498(+)
MLSLPLKLISMCAEIPPSPQCLLNRHAAQLVCPNNAWRASKATETQNRLEAQTSADSTGVCSAATCSSPNLCSNLNSNIRDRTCKERACIARQLRLLGENCRTALQRTPSSKAPMHPRGKHKLRPVLVCLLVLLAASGLAIQLARRRGLSRRLQQHHPLVLSEVVQQDPGAVTASQRIQRAEATARLARRVVRFPKRIHQTVRNKTQLTCQQRKVVDSWKALNPGYIHQLWDDRDIREFMLQYYPDLVPIPYDEFLSGAERSDLWRVLVLHKLGGVYADLDVQCLKPIDDWNSEHQHDAQVLLGMENYDSKRPRPIHVTNWVLAAAPGHPLPASMPAIVAKATQHQFFDVMRQDGPIKKKAYEDGIIDRTGPAALSWAMYEYFKSVGQNMTGITDKVVSSGQGFMAGGVRVLPIANMGSGWEVAEARRKGEKFTCEDVAKKVPNAYVCHMFMGSWRTDWAYKGNAAIDECH